MPKIGLKSPTAVQEEAIPPLLQGKDILIHAETGSGKTAAFVLPMLDRLYRDPRGIFGVVIVPTREIALQTAEQIRLLGNNNTVRCACAVGGVDYVAQKREIEEAPHFIVGTPGRLCEQLKNSDKARKYLRNIEWVVMDEADKLLEPSLMHFVKEILAMIGKKVQRVYCTATVDESEVSRLETVGGGKILRVGQHRAMELARAVTLRYLLMPLHVRDCYFVHLLNQFKGNDIMVFINSVERAHLVYRYLSILKMEVVILHSFLTQAARTKAISMFKNQQARIFITTDIASRGIDIKTVDIVINYDLPRDHRDFVHRVGRTARGGRVGLAISLVTQSSVGRLKTIEAGLGIEMTAQDLDEESALKGMSSVLKSIKQAEMDISTKGEDLFFQKIRERKEQFRGMLQKRRPDNIIE